MDNQTDWYGPDSATFGDRVAAAREATGMTQAELSKRLGVKLKTLQSWENDTAEPRANRLSMMAGLLNVSMGWLLTGDGEGVSEPDAAANEIVGMKDVLLEIRAIKTDMIASAERIGRLEKKLRGLSQPADP